jgi:hypothetical protein
MCDVFRFDSCTVHFGIGFGSCLYLSRPFHFISHVILAVVGVCLGLVGYADETNISMIFNLLLTWYGASKVFLESV